MPNDATGLKTLARIAGFKWLNEYPGGSQSMAWSAEYMDDPVGKPADLDRVIAYNEDDGRQTLAQRERHEQGTAK